MNLKQLKKDKQRLNDLIFEFVLTDPILCQNVTKLDLVNTYSFAVKLRNRPDCIMLYTTGLKVYDCFDERGTFNFTTLEELREYLIKRNLAYV